MGGLGWVGLVGGESWVDWWVGRWMRGLMAGWDGWLVGMGGDGRAAGSGWKWLGWAVEWVGRWVGMDGLVGMHESVGMGG